MNAAQSTAVVALLAALLGGQAAGGDEPRQDQIVIAETPDTFQVSMPVSRLVMTFPRSGFSVDLIDEETDGPSYFSFHDSGRGALMTGWFEPAHLYKGIRELWKSDVAAWKKNGLPEPVNVEFTRIGDWEAVLYDTNMPTGANTHVRAQWVEDGTWIDLHISVTTAEPLESARKAARDILESVRIAATAAE